MTTHRARHATPRLRRPSALAAFVLLAAACQVQPSLDRAETDVQGDGFRILHLGRANTSSLSYTIDVGSAESDVYVVFTNPGGEQLSAPALRTSTGMSGSVHSARASGSDDSPRTSTSSGERGRGVSGTPLLRELSAEIPVVHTTDELNGGNSITGSIRMSGESTYQSNERELLWGLVELTNTSYDFDQLPACAAEVRQPTEDRHGLVLWVQEEAPNGDDACDPIDEIDLAPENLLDIADAFRVDAGYHDIYSVLSDIYGTPWGSHNFHDLIDPTQKYVHVFLMDINEAGPPSSNGSFIAGYFLSIDTYLGVDPSNERLILYLHGPAYAEADNADWAITDFWPSELTMTAAHELQHLINWYQKTVARDLFDGSFDPPRNQTWLDELMSLLSEEYVGPLLGERFGGDDDTFLGPRGIDPLDTSAGDAGTTSGRLPLFNYRNMRDVTYWPLPGSGENPLPDYSASYAFGAWLTRNYGGIRLMRDILDNNYVDERAVTTAVRRHGGALTFGELLERWGASVVLSDRRIPVRGYRYRAANGFTSAIGDTEVTLGSIDLHNYLQDENGTFTEAGPRYFTSSRTFADEHGSSQTGYSNVYYKGPQGVTGNVDLEMSASADTRVSIIIKERLE